MSTKIGLGTAQLGLDYGVANGSGRPTDEQARETLRVAWEQGVRVLDTAPGYGDAEERIGNLSPTDADSRVVTKTRGGATPDRFRADVEGSLERLGVSKLHGLLVHDPDVLSGGDASAVVDALGDLRDAGLADRVGVSIYDAHQAQQAIDTGVLDLVQVPVSVLDQRLIQDGTLDRLQAAGFEVHARSVFLQGLLLMSRETLPAHLNAAARSLDALHAWCADQALTALEAAFGFVNALAAIDTVLVGVDDAAQLSAILTAARRVRGRGIDPEKMAHLANDDETVLNPSQWRSL